MTLGKKLALYRASKGLTQQNLGEHLRVSAQAISKWENDLTAPDIQTLKKLAELYGVTLDRLVDLGEDVENVMKREREQEKGSAYKKEEAHKSEDVREENFRHESQKSDSHSGEGARTNSNPGKSESKNERAPHGNAFDVISEMTKCINCNKLFDERNVATPFGVNTGICLDCHANEIYYLTPRVYKRLGIFNKRLTETTDRERKKIVSDYREKSRKKQILGNVVGGIVAAVFYFFLLFCSIGGPYTLGEILFLPLLYSAFLFFPISLAFIPSFVRRLFTWDPIAKYWIPIAEEFDFLEFILDVISYPFELIFAFICAPVVYPYAQIKAVINRKKFGINEIVKEYKKN